MRIRSVDVFRGVTVAAMVIVNNPGDWNTVYRPLLHAEWHGWTPTDLIFPFFLFIVGVAITLSPRSTSSLGGVMMRSATIFALGLFLAGFPFFNLSTWRIPGVLQRIAVCYLSAVLIVRATTPRAGDTRVHLQRLGGIAVALIVSYAVLMQWVPVPGGQAGDLSAEGNLGAWLDRALMEGHLWQRRWDPEGLLSTVPAIATTLIGVMAGQMRLIGGTLSRWRWALLVSGFVCVVLGETWSIWFPINKSLWTSSYVLFTAGMAAIALAICSWWTDEEQERWLVRTSEPFVALGRNAILLFVLSGLVGRLIGVVMVNRTAGVNVKSWIYSTLFTPLAPPRNASLLFAVANLAALYLLLAWLHRRRWYWKV